MSESSAPGSPSSDNPQPPNTARPAKRRGRLMLRIIAGAVLLLVLLILAAPTLLSTGPVVSIVLGKLNQQLNGKVQLSSLSLGWFTGVSVRGLRVDDAAGAQIAEVDHAVIPFALWKAITGNFALGEVALDGVSFDAKIDSKGNLNFAQLTKNKSTAPEPAPAPTDKEKKQSRLPNVSADLKLSNCHGTFSQAGKPTVYLTRLDGDVKIPDINSPITNTITAALKVGSSPEGTLAITGSASVIKSNFVAMDSANVHQTVEVANLDLQTARPFIPDSAGVETLAGAIGIHIALDVTNGKTAGLDAAFTASQPIAIGGKVLKGDTFTTKTLDASIPKLMADFPDGLDQWQSARIKVGTEPGAPPISLKLDQGQITATADLSPQAILNVIAKNKPGSAGQLAITSSFDLAKIIPQLRNTTSLAQGVLIESAGFTQNLKLTMTPDQASFSNTADSTRAVGTQKLANGQTQPISIDPIHVSVSADDLGGGGTLPDLHKIALKLTAPFATGDFQGESLGDLHGNLTANLASLGDEIRQFVDLGKIKLGGDLTVNITGSGQLTQAPYQADVKATVQLKNLAYGDAAGERVNEPFAQMVVSGTLHGSEKSTLESAKNVVITLQTGDTAAPTVDVLAEVPGVSLTGTTAGDFKLSRFTVDLAKLQKELAAVPAGQAGIVVNRGNLSVTSAGKFNGPNVSVDSLSVDGQHLFVARQLSDARQVQALADDTVHLTASGDLDQERDPGGKPIKSTVRLKTLTLSDFAQIIDIHKSGDGDFLLSETADGGIAGQGQLDLFAQLGSISAIEKILTANKPTGPSKTAAVQSGTLAGTLSMTPAGTNKTGINGNFKLDSVVVTTDKTTLPGQSATVTLKAIADQSAKTIAIDLAGIDSNLATASITNATVSLAAQSVLDKVQAAHWEVNVPDLKPVMDLANAYSPAPTPAEKTAKSSTGKPLPPLKFNSGSITASGDLSHEGSTLKVSMNQLAGQNIAFTRGDIHYAAKPINASLLALVQTGDGKKLMEQIKEVQITQLTGNLGIATLSMPTPVSISQLSSSPVANGVVQLSGNLTDLTTLLTALQGEKPDAYPYRGDYTASENITTQQNTISLKGGLQIAKFQAFNGNTITFSEDLIAIANDLALTTAGDDQSVAINSLTAAMQSSGALNISLRNGSIQNLNSSRTMQLQLNANYDLAKLWPIVQPMMGDSYKTLKVTGQYQKQFNVTGSYPADQPSTAAIKTLHADGDLAVATFDYDGISMQNFIVPFTLDNGQLVTVYTGKPPGQNTAAPAVTNGGTLDLGNLTIDLTQDPPRLTVPPNKLILSQVTINPVLSGTVLEKLVNNPLFAGGKTGLIDLTIDDCTDLPLGNLVTLQTPANTGKADLRLSITKIHVGLPADQLQSILKQTSFEADIKDGIVSIARGISTEHIKFNTGQYVLSFDGNVRLRDEAYMPMTLGFPLKIIATKTHLMKGRGADYLPDQIQVPLEGTVSKTRYRFDKTIPKAITDAAAKALAGGILGGNKNGDNSNPLGGLLKGLQKNQGN